MGGSSFFWCSRAGSTFTHLSRGSSRRSTGLQPSPARPRTARSAPRPRARRNRALLNTALCSLECIAVEPWFPRLTLPHQHSVDVQWRQKEAAKSNFSRKLLRTFNRVLTAHTPACCATWHWWHLRLSGTVAPNQERFRSMVHVLLYLVQLQLFRFLSGCPALCCKRGIRPIL